MDLTTFGEALRKYREELNLSQQELAIILGTSKQVLSRYETGQRDPKISTAREYAEKLHLPLTYFLKTGFEEEKTVTAESDDLLTLSDFERQVLMQLRLLSQEQQKAFLAFLTTLLNNQSP